ncbi:hypothetical protein TOPH_09138 [Tolypocladium ophioglossoides CBS 100239]|uniref:Uncharacterized protein n=1 Tax=Tolypocladium ophioglossoides (strain CBS 100239) TaxID=1163406 RepID=A0A0L0MXM3_TOLOC|nr:hypothetical protein TOPH_09138 [Tolypocladium ophioglossoides CBS 100239]
MDIPIIDGDTMGRAFPKVDMALPYVYGKATPTPAVLSDARGSVQIIAQVEDSHRFETIIRSACVELGLSAALSLAPLPRTLVEQYCCLVIDVQQRTTGGWTIGTATLEPFNDEDEAVAPYDGKQLTLSYQIEFFSASLQDPAEPTAMKTLCTTPDLITVTDASSGSALGTHELRYGLRVAAIAMPAHPLWLTEAGLKIGGPAAFG